MAPLTCEKEIDDRARELVVAIKRAIDASTPKA